MDRDYKKVARVTRGYGKAATSGDAVLLLLIKMHRQEVAHSLQLKCNIEREPAGSGEMDALPTKVTKNACTEYAIKYIVLPRYPYLNIL